MRLKGYGFIVAAAVMWGMIGPFSKVAFEAGVAPLEVAFWRATIAWGFFAAHAGISGQIRIRKNDIGWVVLFAVLGVTCFYGSYQLAIQAGGAAMAAVLLYTAPAWVTLMSRVFFKETIDGVKILALIMTIAGVAMISLGGGGDALQTVTINVTAVFFGLAAGFCYSTYYILGKLFSKKRYTSPTLFLYMLPLGAAGLVPWVSFVHKTPAAWAAMTALAFLCTYGAYFCYYLGIQYLEPSRASITASLEPVVAGVVAYLWWHEIFSATGYVGSALILGAVVLVVIRPHKQEGPSHESHDAASDMRPSPRIPAASNGSGPDTGSEGR